MSITINGSGTISGASTLSTTVASPSFTTPTIDSAQFATVTGTAPLYSARAWVNFNGTGTVAIRASGNVSSITDKGTGDYTINFTTAMSDANYAVNGTGYRQAGTYLTTTSLSSLTAPAVGSCRISSADSTGVLTDSAYINVTIFR